MTEETPSWVKNAKVGDKVVCLYAGTSKILTKGDVVTISEIIADLYGIDLVTPDNRDYSVIIVLREHPTSPLSGKEIAFMPKYFRPITKAKSTSKQVSKLIRMAKETGKVEV